MKTSYVWICIFSMAVLTYFTRVTSMILFKKKIRNRFMNSFLYYTPYTVLAALVFPAIFFSTENWISSLIGAFVALILAYFSGQLLIVAGGAVLAVYLTEWIMRLM